MTDFEAKFQKIAEQVEIWREESGAPGVTFGIYVKGERYSGGSGVTSIDNPLPVTDETIFQIGSISKTFTATMMMRLVEQGKLDLDERVRSYLPQFRVRDEDVSQRVAVRHLLTHVAGWTGDVFTDTGNNDEAMRQYVEGMAEFEQLAPLDFTFSYNNAAFAVAGRIIEALTGMTYEEAARQHIFEPLGMEGSTFFPHEVVLKRFAVGHQVTDEGTKALSPWAIPRAMNAGGGIACHIQDLLRYGAYHLGEGAPLLQPQSLRQMHTPQVSISDYVGAVGLSWIVNDIDGIRLLWHNGGTNGQNSILTLAPEYGLALGMMTNGDKGGAINDKFNKRVLRDFCGIDIPEPQAIESSVEALVQYAGRYKGTMADIELRMDGADLVAIVEAKAGLPTDAPRPQPAPMAVARCGVDVLMMLDGDYKNSRADIIRDAKGDIRYLRFGSRIRVKQ